MQHANLPGPWDKNFFARPTGLQKLVGKHSGEEVLDFSFEVGTATALPPLPANHPSDRALSSLV